MAHSMRFVDAIVTVAASTVLVWYGINGGPAGRMNYEYSVGFFAFSFLVAFLILAERMHIYHARRTEEVARELFAVSEVALYAGCIAIVATEIWGAGLPRYSYLEALGAAVFALPAMRLAMRYTIRRLRRRGDDYRVWLIVGHNDRAAELTRTILASPHFGIRIAQVIDIAEADAPPPAIPEEFKRAPLSAVTTRVLPGLEAVRELVATHVIDEVVVTLPVRSCYDKIRAILDICCEAGISVKLEPEVFVTQGYSTEVVKVGSISMVTHFSGPSNYRLLTAKRVIDFVATAVALVVLTPVLAALALAVKLTSPGPALFFQTRVGLHGRHFRMVKFRSMVRDAPQIRAQLDALNERDGTAFKIRNDARVTPLGRWMRKYHLDELPQLWNVMVGDMSLVGPRPLPVGEAFGDEWWQRRRLTMPPGLTCYWQLADDPKMPFRQWMELDMAYIDRWSLWLDLKLIVRTFGTVMRGNGW
jgi:exopolysaccharide biosynthesis polyprenyl glycosylphosphotransferase